MFLKRISRKIRSFVPVLEGTGRVSYSQAGEDQVLHYLFGSLSIPQPYYLDIGANHPRHGSNTYFFYSRGSEGVCIEPHPQLAATLRQVRPRDLVLNVGIGLTSAATAEFYSFEEPYSGWNTFSREEAELRKAEGVPYKEVLQIPLEEVNHILEHHCRKLPDLVSVDVEGLDFDIIRSLDFSRYPVRVLVVETLQRGESTAAVKRGDIIDFMLSKGYRVYADTWINTIFLKENP